MIEKHVYAFTITNYCRQMKYSNEWYSIGCAASFLQIHTNRCLLQCIKIGRCHVFRCSFSVLLLLFKLQHIFNCEKTNQKRNLPLWPALIYESIEFRKLCFFEIQWKVLECHTEFKGKKHFNRCTIFQPI